MIRATMSCLEAIAPYWEHVVSIFSKIVTFPIWKSLFTGVILVATYLFGTTNVAADVALFMLIMGDTVTGMAAAYVEGQAIQSRKAVKTAFKIIVYYGAVASAIQTEHAGVNFLPLESTVTSWLAVTEFISILENFGRMGYATPNKLLNRLTDYRDNKLSI